MENIDDLATLWKKNNYSSTRDGLSPEALKRVVQGGVTKENNTVMKYFWASFAWQVMIYSYSSFLIIRHPHTIQFVLPTVATVLLYIPFTITLLRKFKSMHKRSKIASSKAILQSLEHRHLELATFFRFKKRFEWIAVPVICLLLVSVLFSYFSIDPLKGHLSEAIITYISIIAAFVLTIRHENKKSFKEPILNLSEMIAEMKGSKTTPS
jgi:hypothetical protein